MVRSDMLALAWPSGGRAAHRGGFHRRLVQWGWAALAAGAFLLVPVDHGQTVCGQEPADDSAASADDPHPEMLRLSPTEKVWLDRTAAQVVVGGEVVLQRGQIEFFACPRRTKEHESVVAVDATARLVHTALLAIGLQVGSPVQFAPEYRAARGPRVRIEVRWTDDAGHPRRIDAQEWIRDTRTGKAMQAEWVFAGSSLWKDEATGKEYYQADGGDLVCVSNFPTATLDLTIPSSQSNEALLFEVFESQVPPRGTPVELVFSAAAE
jgi:hypothetical protein